LIVTNIEFKNLIELEAWQEIQSNFSAVTQIPMRTVDPAGRPLTKFSGAPHLCSELLTGSPLLIRECTNCLPGFLRRGGGNRPEFKLLLPVWPAQFHRYT